MESETRESHRVSEYRRMRRRQRMQRRLILCCVLCVLAFLSGFGGGWFARGLMIREPVDLSAIKAPGWIDQQFIAVNPYSRPGTKLSSVNGIVIHYVGNPGTTAQQNRDYFDGLKRQSGSNTTSVSSHFVIGLDGEIIQCIPVDEKAFASNNRNSDTISIECCHPEADGVFTEETYESLIKLTAWLCTELKLEVKNVIRHYDVTGKECPKAFVEDEGAWKQFRKDVKKAMR
ncbi:MAG: peptidoglycan recognition family protein [Clostridium sp.]|nr:peptidoglycan recognition protein family protein [Clostridiaceae bacterium]MDD6073466.1 peptidoglycan recognition family protein [Clostridium sp.]MDY5484746.1 peptidoglycan recognition family protein [Clostridium sp.]